MFVECINEFHSMIRIDFMKKKGMKFGVCSKIMNEKLIIAGKRKLPLNELFQYLDVLVLFNTYSYSYSVLVCNLMRMK